MKKKISKHIAIIIFSFIVFTSYGQSINHCIPPWASDKGYWVVESNLHQPLQHTVRFYSNGNILIGTQEINARLNIKRRKIKMHLKSMLESSLLAWTKENATPDSTGLVKKP